MRRFAGLLSAVVVLTVLAAPLAQAADSSLFPFVLPWDDAAPGITDLSGWLDAPAGQRGHVRAGPDGHLYVGQERIRLFGVDVTYSAALPTREQATAVSARLAKFGVNLVRFHIIDQRQFPFGLFARDGRDTRRLDPEALDRLDYFVEQLRRRGIYSDLNLLTYRPLSSADGLPPEVDTVTGHVLQRRLALGFFDEAILELQREYARQLLTHVNPYTGHAYTAEPCVAFVEINNENGLLHAWLGGWLEGLPPLYADELRARWNAWLARRYDSEGKLREAWQVAADPLGEELLAPGAPAEVESWELQQNEGAVGQKESAEDLPAEVRPNCRRPAACT